VDKFTNPKFLGDPYFVISGKEKTTLFFCKKYRLLSQPGQIRTLKENRQYYRKFCKNNGIKMTINRHNPSYTCGTEYTAVNISLPDLGNQLRKG
jgi:hypothetical protein